MQQVQQRQKAHRAAQPQLAQENYAALQRQMNMTQINPERYPAVSQQLNL